MCNSSTSIFFEPNSQYFSSARSIFTISIPDSQILVVNSTACQLLNYSSDELCCQRLEDLICESSKEKWSKLKIEFFKNSFLNTQTICDNSKLLELITRSNDLIIVSMCLKKLDNPSTCLAIAEPFDRRQAVIAVDQQGKILSCDDDSIILFQYDASDLVNADVHILLPALNLSKTSEVYSNKSVKQYITGEAKSNDAFPVCATATSCTQRNLDIFRITVWAFINLNGLLVLNYNLLLKNCNQHFIKFLFGYSKRDVINKSILFLIPNFCNNTIPENEFNYQFKNINDDVNRDDDDDDDDGSGDIDFTTLFHKKKGTGSPRNSEDPFSYEGECPEQAQGFLDPDSMEKKVLKDKLNIPKRRFRVQEGKFFGFGKHNDGALISINYQVKKAVLNDEVHYCVWVSTRLSACGESCSGFEFPETLTFDSSSSDILPSKQTINIGDYREGGVNEDDSSLQISQCDDVFTDGEYGQHYTNISKIGKGTFGYVKLAFRHSDGLLVVTKFIKKQKVNIASWVYSSDLKMEIPLEISFLASLQHPNIVKVLDVFHNEYFVQLVMEKHGAGFDLFEFIERGLDCDEKLKSFIFRQIVSAVHYLDSLDILHRDIKDENIIINERFEVKLIDFGLATFKPPDERFSKFCGTVEYCSPEVLLGNRYRGPELEIWALGVTLYILTFGKIPFCDIVETVRGQFTIPAPISEELEDLLYRMLDRNVETRITIDNLVENCWVTQPVKIDDYKFEQVVSCYDHEAHPPKYVYEIRSKAVYTGDTEPSSEQNDSFENIECDRYSDIFDSFCDIEIDSDVEPRVLHGKNNSEVLLSSSSVKKTNFRWSKSAVVSKRHLGNTSILMSRSKGVQGREGRKTDDNFPSNICKLKRLNKSLPNFLDSKMDRTAVNDDLGVNSDLEMCFRKRRLAKGKSSIDGTTPEDTGNSTTTRDDDDDDDEKDGKDIGENVGF